MSTLAFITFVDIDIQGDCSTTHRRKSVAHHTKVSCYQSKEVRGFGKGVFPFGHMTTFSVDLCLYQVSITKEYRIALGLSNDHRGKG